MEPKRIFLKDYRPPVFTVSKLDLHFDLAEDVVRVKNTMTLKRLGPGPLELDGVQLKLVSIHLISAEGRRELLGPEKFILPEGNSLENQSSKLTLIDPPSEEFTLEIVTEIKPHENKALDGLYKSGSIFCTQCEAQGFRKITYFFDRPDVMTTYQVTIEADEKKYPCLLSNGDRLSVESLGNGRHRAIWRDPHKKPSYLFALVAGDLGVIQDHFVTQSGRQVLLEIFAPHGQQKRCLHAMASLKKSMKWDEKRFGREYDLNNFMIVAIEDFNGGAMENKGLNIFNSRLILADPKMATDTDYQTIESVVAHEYLHNWTGNRVTLRDWFQLSLKEGLTVFRDHEFSADMGNRGLQRIESVDILRSRQFSEDAGPNAHPVRPESCLSVDNFYTATIYEKGAEVIRMMQILTGRRGFRLGMDRYFEKHDGQAVTTDDFALAIAEANHLDLTQFKLWYQQFGTPKIQVQEQFDGDRGEYTLTLSQSLPVTANQPDPKPMSIPILFGLLSEKGDEIELPSNEVSRNSDGEAVLHLNKSVQSFRFSNLKSKPIPSLFRDFSAPVAVQWEAPLSTLLLLMKRDRDGFNRREMAQRISMNIFRDLLGGNRVVPEDFLLAIREIVTSDNIDAGFKANLLTLPSDSLLVQAVDVLDAEALRTSRNLFENKIALFCEAELKELYRKLHRAPYLNEISIQAFGVRALKNRVLSLLQSLGQSSIESMIEAQYYQSENMTDRLSAMSLLVESENSQIRNAVLAHFREEFQNEALVLNKWLAVQAGSSRCETYQEVQKLLGHPLFQKENPNHIYSLMRTLGNNFVVFHQKEGVCYPFYLKFIEELDLKNPQVAARLCEAFNVYRKLPEMGRSRLFEEVTQVLANPNLSRNTRELLGSIEKT